MHHNWTIIQLKDIDSTNNYARLLIEDKKLDTETVIFANHQSHGRGQQENKWASEPGKNLTATVVLFPNYLKAEKQFYLSIAVSLAITELLKSEKIDSEIKWPNDIHAGGKKIAGILIENSVINDILLYSIIGIGLNVNQQIFNDLPGATSMKNLTGTEFDLNRLPDRLLLCLEKQIEKLKKNKFQDLKREYIRKLYKFEKEGRFSSNSQIFTGKIVDVDENGCLIVLKDDGTKQGFMFKEVRYLD
jgi:BirA family transcriptional regulator, biotin operon repressor / biotin---[acetyl-CoA-carboxylase] ligase